MSDNKVEFKDLETLDEFKWDESTPEIDFFGEKSNASTKVEDVVEKVLEEDVGEKKEVKKEDETKPLNIDWFDEGERQEIKEEVKPDNTEEKVIPSEKTSAISTVSFLKDKGHLSYELEEGEELTEELAENILEDNQEAKVEERVQELLEDLPPIMKQLNKFVMNGGDIGTFLSKVNTSKTANLSENLDISKEENQELVVKLLLKEEDYDDEYINTQVEFLKDSGKLAKIAEAKFSKWKDKKEEERQTLATNQAEIKKQEKLQRRKLKSSIVETLKDVEDYGGLVVTSKDKKSLPDYMTDRSIILENGGRITAMQRDLHAAMTDKKKAIILAKLLNNDFNFDSIIKTGETKNTKKVKDNVRRVNNNPSKSTSGSSQKAKKSLADYF